MQNPPFEIYTPFIVNDAYVFTTDDKRTYEVEFVEQPFFAEDEYAYA